MYFSGLASLAQSIQHKLRTDTYNHLQTREIEFLENHRMGETMAMLNDDVNQIGSTIDLTKSFNCLYFFFAGS